MSRILQQLVSESKKNVSKKTCEVVPINIFRINNQSLQRQNRALINTRYHPLHISSSNVNYTVNSNVICRNGSLMTKQWNLPKHVSTKGRFQAHTPASNCALYILLLYSGVISNTNHSQCETLEQSMSNEHQSTLVSENAWKNKKKRKNKLKKALLILKRVVQVLLSFFPALAAYPIYRLTSDLSYDSKASDWYLKLCLRCVEWSGATTIKLMQVRH